MFIDLGAGDDVADVEVFRPSTPGPLGPVAPPGLDLQVLGGTGDDTVGVQVDSLESADVYVHARLGDGTNTFVGSVFNSLENDPSAGKTRNLLFDVRGGSGSDTMDLEANGITAEGYNIQTVFRGGAGDDILTANMDLIGNHPSVAKILLDGGTGDDFLSAARANRTSNGVNADVPASFASDQVQLLGGLGDDSMETKFTQTGHNATVTVDGAAGTDDLMSLVHLNPISANKVKMQTKAVEDESTFTF
jgi:hypothetical protein